MGLGGPDRSGKDQMMTGTVLILGGSGKIGRRSAEAFAAAGWTVRRWQRGTDMTAAARGADVIVNGLNPPGYHDWARLIPRITAQVIAAARASGATVIVPGNIYNFGRVEGELSETTPQNATTRKGRIRVAMEQTYRDAGLQTIILRAGNFIDPGSRDDVMTLLYLRSIGKGRITFCGDPTVMQAYAYVPDWARAAVMLAERRATLARFEDVPFPGHAFTGAELQTALTAASGRALKAVRFPWAFIRLASPFWELARELQEMRYLWDMPHHISGAKFARLLPDFTPTDLRTVMLSGLPTDIHPDKAMRPGQIAI
jgi:nucleoside-diphosphate-sugar epimerase